MLKQHVPSLLDDEILSEEEVRQILRCTNKTLYRRRKDKSLPGIPINSRRYLYRKSAVLKFLEHAEAGTLRTFTPSRMEAAEMKALNAASNRSKRPSRKGMSNRKHKDVSFAPACKDS
jgi:hypothetical protein